PAGPAQARAVDEDPQRTQLRGGLDRGAHLLLVGDVGLDVHPADLAGDLLALVVLQVEHDDLAAALGEQPRRRLAQARRASGHDGRRTRDVHAFYLSTPTTVR